MPPMSCKQLQQHALKVLLFLCPPPVEHPRWPPPLPSSWPSLGGGPIWVWRSEGEQGSAVLIRESSLQPKVANVQPQLYATASLHPNWSSSAMLEVLRTVVCSSIRLGEIACSSLMDNVWRSILRRDLFFLWLAKPCIPFRLKIFP